MDDQKTPTGPALLEEDALRTIALSSVAMVLTNPHYEDNPIVYVNRAFEKVTGYARDSAIGRNCRFLQCEDTDPEKIDQLREAIAQEREITVELLNARSDGSRFVSQLRISPVYGDDGALTHFLGIQTVIDEAPQGNGGSADEAMTELQHRVKNHLSMIVSLIRIQSRQSSAKLEYENLSRRVESLQMLYEELVRPKAGSNRESVDIGSYLTRVANAIAHLDGRAGILVNINVVSIDMSIDPATRIGLIISEVLTNALQHAFHGRERGVVELRVSRLTDGGMRATISDDGIGFADGVTWPNTDSLGGRIVQGLIDGLDGSLDASCGAGGTTVTLEVPGRAFA
ncbi:PAS domain-containing protein [Profundibacterium mesophilum]|uniref:Sensor histidine kinase n=1 Tax=Profundibacterium mesophilum KAUST100406-0324 TaxID=1037889 RepID=A0A921TD68_9RHOB|nr:PAS domain-containing protein [Profundibacterium mesophilum]KAF0675807.1 Sensor histidine kinase [Profundibacterium mesophilum KAUST100406-0324]